ncbi:ABC transporter ATP-binding protein [Agromyces archimandritae]|uniref:ABC transporter ATP-binding protein n=1 Tax=Agromyces archimandritae TaxID=2781962 RepID=UPI001FD3E156|nr:ATP-binding cassette domain-containing protein [Agromyces archimandritae]
MSEVRPAAVRAEDWSWRHAGRRSHAVSGASFDIEAGERVLLLGASGAGKSTLLHGLAGVLGGDEEGEAAGRLLVDGRPPAPDGRSGLVLQDPDAQIVMSRLADDVAFGCENLGVPPERIGARVRGALDAVGLALPADHPTSALSGGQRQRLALAGVIAMQPGLVLLDEPTANLDPAGVIEVRDAVARCLDASGATLIVVEHRIEAWLPLVDRVIVLAAGGGVLADGPPDRVLADASGELAAAGVWLPGAAPGATGAAAGGATDPVAGAAPSASEPLLTADGLAVGRSGVAVRTGIRTRLDAGRLLAITGPNGVGKTTLGLTLAGLLPPVAGRLEASGALRDGARSAHPIEWRSKQLLTRIGTVFQHPEHQFLRGSVRAELEVGPDALRLGRRERDARVAGLLDALRLDRLAGANPFTLSGGEKRRLSVATALIARPRLLILDEPTFGQDARTWQELVRLIAEVRDGGTGIAAITHDEAFAAALGDARLHLGARAEVRA